eukprot:COSAG05_NODE_2543_length_2926_cov_1.632826_2_plen_66_part_00
MLDADDSGTLTYNELKDGLPEVGVFLTNDQFKSVMRLIDPDQDKDLTLDEWLNFMQAVRNHIDTP